MKAGVFRTVVLMLLTCVCSSCADVVDEKEIMASDMVLIYSGGAKCSVWDKEHFSDYVSYTDMSGKSHWLFDGFLFLCLWDAGAEGAPDLAFCRNYDRPCASRWHWECLLSYYFRDDHGIGTLECAVSDVIIPCQSVFDVRIAARLGFKVIEANVHETATPGKYIVMHGVRGRLGDQVTRLDGSSAADVVIRETPFDELMTQFVYRSKYAKYRTRITSLEEFLVECRRNNIAPMVSHIDKAQVEFVRSIMGNNFILYWGGRDEFDGPILEYWDYRTKEQILGRCRHMGPPYMYCMGNTRAFTDEHLEDICREVHKPGCHIGFAGCYENPAQSEKLLGLGFDFSASGWDINEIGSGNLCNLTADLVFDDFKTNGKVEDCVLILEPGQTINPKVRLNSEFLSGGSLHIHFKGRIHVKMGDYIDHDYESDGSRSTWISTYFMEQAPVFEITAAGHAEVMSMTYKASKM